MASAAQNLATPIISGGRRGAVDTLFAILKESKPVQENGYNDDDLRRTVKKIEEANYFLTIRALVQASEANFDRIYDAFLANLKFNLTKYQYANELIVRILEEPSVTLSSIILNGPLELNQELKEIRELRKREDESKKKALRVGNVGSGVRCQMCKGTKINMRLQQDRGGDEAMTKYFTCLNEECEHTWKKN